MKKFAIVIVALLCLSSCKTALDREYHADTLNSDLEVIIARDNMTEDELHLFNTYLVNAEINDIDLEGKTYREILEAAKKQ